MQHKTLQGLIWAPHQKDTNCSTVLNGTHLAWEFFFLSDSPSSVVNHWWDPHFFICSLTEPSCTAWVGQQMPARGKAWNSTHRNTAGSKAAPLQHAAGLCLPWDALRIGTQRAAMIASCRQPRASLVQECNVPKHISARMQGQAAGEGMGERRACSQTNLVQRC